ncbi:MULTISPECIES: XrtA system polysaccharide deacetylase [Vibrio]|uniref:DUF3473 domain-containing protein n=2 Tax=Vibrio TaxID=662 RepID=A0A7X4LQ42_9VIBR|nr:MULTISPECIES: XrtA system polysaccharide deacetylase [Vibrio]MBF9002159.1 DUF3473 domain-containing protein [Vibrio nitrifigilis]MZI95536.1 DUF3473 domain-containing protein [Vibrio eleionomae]
MIQTRSNAMTVDVEDYFQVAAFENQVKFSDWGKKYEVRVEQNTDRLLALFDEHQTKATFFMLGWVAEHCPQLVKRIVEQGHELASHGYAHQRANTQSPEIFREDVYRAKSFLEDTTGIAVHGYRAPSFSVNPDNEWVFEILADVGFTFSSSTYPVKRDLYGAPDWPRLKYRRPEGIVEIPLPTNTSTGFKLPIGGGGFFRLYPYKMSQWLISQFMEQTNQPFCFYFHPWEIDDKQPRMAGIPLKSRFRHYLNLNRMESRLEQLLTDFKWDTVSHAYQLNG